MRQQNQAWDAIVIGGGTGGLTTAAYLAANGMRTLVLEAQPVIGGAAQEFRRSKVFHFSTGAHYIGDCELDGVIPTVLRGVGLEGEVAYNNMDPDGFDRVVAPGLDLRVPRGWRQFEIRLTRMFPDDAAGIRRTLRTLREAAEALEVLGAPPLPGLRDLARHPRTLFPLTKGLITLEQLFCQHRLSEEARAAISYICMFLLLPRTRLTVAFYGSALNHYIKSGGWYVRGGVARIPSLLARVIGCNGGEVRLRSRIDKILVEGKRVRGVRLQTGEDIYAPVVISNADIKTTYGTLLDPQHTSARTRLRIAQAPLTPSLFSVYLGLDIDLRKYMSAEHRFYTSTLNLDKILGSGILQSGTWKEFEELGEYSIWVTSPSLKDEPRPGTEGFSSLEITTATPQSYEFWGLKGGALDGIDYHRDPTYLSRKTTMEQRVIEHAKRHMPFIDGHIVWQESSTMLSHEDWTRSRLGAWAGLDYSLKNLLLRPGPGTEIDGFYLTGASSRSTGAMLGTLRGGVDTASAVLARNLWSEVSSGTVFGTGLTDKEFRNVAVSVPGFHRLQVLSANRDTPESIVIELDVPDNLRDEYRFTAGQYVVVGGQCAGETVRRSYSICEPVNTGRLRIGIKEKPGGTFSPYALTLRPGDHLDVSSPRGVFTYMPLENQSHQYVFIAAGSGITPMMSLIGTILSEEPTSEVTLLYGSRTREQIMFAAEINKIAAKFGKRFTFTHYLSRQDIGSTATRLFQHGRIDQQTLESRLATDIDGATIHRWFLCGPQLMVLDLEATLRQHNVDPRSISVELFDTQSGSQPIAGRPGPPAAVTLLTDAGDSTFDIPRNTDTILDYAIQRTEALPYSCQSGSCGTCVAKVSAGQAEMDHVAHMPLSDEQIAEGYVLTCLARPISDELVLDLRTR